MPCEVIHHPKLGEIIMCGPGMGPLPRKKCAFCDYVGRASMSLCDWPVWKQVSKRTELAEVDDVWITKQEGKRGRIVEITDYQSEQRPRPGDFVARQIWVLIPGHPKPYPYLQHSRDGEFVTEALGTCDTPCCFRHRRHVGLDKDYCMDHWQSWEAIS